MPVWRGKNFVYDAALQDETRGITAARPCCSAGPGELRVVIMCTEAIGNSYYSFLYLSVGSFVVVVVF